MVAKCHSPVAIHPGPPDSKFSVRPLTMLLMVVGSLAVSLVVLASPPPETLTVLVKFVAFGATVTVSVMGG